MRDAALLMVWLVGLFGLIGGVLAAVARFVKKDSVKYDKQFTWIAYSSLWGSNRNKDPDDDGE
ncbi:hypothetical protein [Cohnella silvisoli]|uniref:Uncharacterized protein n=1 Tax=Cohnella silvisoli TaxID=2873699 RepID=A0ABV1KZQ4_9BACL|nr:hypothetical protein [Cohnella silvisoli]MCD9024283.1 hypothetical protein [Cohnella silvisoli]